MYLLDTNHCSQIIFGNKIIREKLEQIEEELIATSVIVAGELIFMAQNSLYKDDNLAKVKSFLNDINIYSFNEETIYIYGELKAKIIDKFGPKEKVKKRKFTIQNLGISDNDLWIASTVIQENLILVSTDKDFLRIKQVHNFCIENWLV
ncbi:type II toxin-antitoxin system VapC family toxin [Geminocystis sp. CENA526]|uniref:type II toxin-antitoxin system VapC family toxin n=1 Tax=Geminocystis sp. CENA526 TaxID=1355871 RepID=UPI003D6F24B7